jgi:hypothetical protein
MGRNTEKNRVGERRSGNGMRYLYYGKKLKVVEIKRKTERHRVRE